MTDIPRLLLNGAQPATPDMLLEFLDRLEIAHHTLDHPPIYTVAEAKTIRGKLPGSHSKNLFLRNKKGRMWLVTCEENRHIDLKQLAKRLNANRFSFASPERLMIYLGVEPGAVTPFALINDETQAVRFVIDRALLGVQPSNFHPLVNTKTTTIVANDLLTFVRACGHEPAIIDFD